MKLQNMNQADLYLETLNKLKRLIPFKKFFLTILIKKYMALLRIYMSRKTQIDTHIKKDYMF